MHIHIHNAVNCVINALTQRTSRLSVGMAYFTEEGQVLSAVMAPDLHILQYTPAATPLGVL